MNWKDVGKRVAGFGLPLLGAALGGSKGEAAGEWLAEKFGVDFGAADAPDRVMAALASDPEATLKLTQIQLEHIEEMARIDLSETQAYLGDRQDARKMRTTLAASLGRDDWMMVILGVGALVTFWLTLGALFVAAPAPGSREILLILIGAETVIVKDVYGYFFGSSKGSSDKTQMMNAGKPAGTV